MRLCSVVRTGMSASGIGWRPMTPQTAVNDFKRFEAMAAWASFAPVTRAKSSFAAFGRSEHNASAASETWDESHAMIACLRCEKSRLDCRSAARRERPESPEKEMPPMGTEGGHIPTRSAATSSSGVSLAASCTKTIRSGVMRASAASTAACGTSNRASNNWIEPSLVSNERQPLSVPPISATCAPRRAMNSGVLIGAPPMSMMRGGRCSRKISRMGTSSRRIGFCNPPGSFSMSCVRRS